jgi:hypothetical protein
MSDVQTDTAAVAHDNNAAPSGGALGLIAQGARSGAADARAAAERAWNNSGQFARRFVYTTSYTISYGVVFSTTLLARSIPQDNAAVRGLIDGARAAREKVDDMITAPHADHAPALATA